MTRQQKIETALAILSIINFTATGFAVRHREFGFALLQFTMAFLCLMPMYMREREERKRRDAS